MNDVNREGVSRKKFMKKNQTYNEIIYIQGTKKRLTPSQNSLSHLGFKSTKKSVDNLIKKKQKRTKKNENANEFRGTMEASKDWEINESEEFSTTKNSLGEINDKNYNKLMSKLNKNGQFSTNRRRKSKNN